MRARAGAVIVNYRSAVETAQCAASLRDENVTDIVVVDNDTDVPCRDTVLAAVETATIVTPGVNLGYGGGVNRGVAALPDAVTHVLVCNADLLFQPGSVASLMSSATGTGATVAVVGPRLRYPDGTPYPSARRFPDPLTAGVHALVGLFAPDNRFSKRYRMQDGALDARTPVDWVSGACMLVRRDAFEALGGFDESYFMYMEDVDLCHRARGAGWGVVFEPSAEVVHAQGVSTAGRPLAMEVAHHRSAMRYAVRTMTGRRRPLVPVAVGVLGVRGAMAMARRALRRPLRSC